MAPSRIRTISSPKASDALFLSPQSPTDLPRPGEPEAEVTLHVHLSSIPLELESKAWCATKSLRASFSSRDALQD